MVDLSKEDELKKLTKEQLLSDELIQQLFFIEDVVFREKTIQALEKQAEKCRCKTDFCNHIKSKKKEIAEARKDLQKKQLAVVYRYTPPESDKTYQTGRWNVGPDGITAKPGGDKEPVQHGADKESHRDPDLSGSAQIDGSRKTHQKPSAHVGSLGGECCDPAV